MTQAQRPSLSVDIGRVSRRCNYQTISYINTLICSFFGMRGMIQSVTLINRHGVNWPCPLLHHHPRKEPAASRRRRRRNHGNRRVHSSCFSDDPCEARQRTAPLHRWEECIRRRENHNRLSPNLPQWVLQVRPGRGSGVAERCRSCL